ncbi:hypothetical protein ACFE04_031889 [Oxalis oulophora]
MELRWISTRKTSSTKEFFFSSKVPIFLSTKSTDILPRAQELTNLYKVSNHSCHRFPKLDSLGNVVEQHIDINKLNVALSHSSILVSVFCNQTYLSQFLDEDINEEKQNSYLEKVIPSVVNGKLVGFGRAVSDLGLTASIYDVMVIPSMRRMGIGRLIVNKITRLLTNKDIYDIAAVCSENERLFFTACGFGNDILGSTTMMYTRSVCSNSQGNEIVKSIGRKLLLVPPINKKQPQSSKSIDYET